VGSCAYDATSTMPMRIAVKIPAAWMIVRRDEYDVDEDGGEDAGGVDYSK